MQPSQARHSLHGWRPCSDARRASAPGARADTVPAPAEVSGAREVAPAPALVPVPEKLAELEKFHAALVKKYEAHLAETAAF